MQPGMLATLKCNGRTRHLTQAVMQPCLYMKLRFYKLTKRGIHILTHQNQCSQIQFRRIYIHLEHMIGQF